MADTKDIDVQAINSGEETLPTFYREGFISFMKEAQKRDPEFRHKWIRVSSQNQHLKALKGWEPVEDPKILERLGLASLRTSNGRARWSDTELWRMPIGRSRLISKHLSAVTAARSQSAKAAMEDVAADTKGRSRGKVVPFLGTDGGTQDLVEKKQVADVTATK